MPEGGTVHVGQHPAGRELRRDPRGARRRHARLPEALIGGAGKGLRGRCARPARGVPPARPAPPRPGRAQPRGRQAPPQPRPPDPQLRLHRRPARQGGRATSRRWCANAVAGVRRASPTRTRRSRPAVERLPGALVADRGGARERARARATWPDRRSRPCGRRCARSTRRTPSCGRSAETGEPILRKKVRPFVRAAQPVRATTCARRRATSAKASPGPARVVLRAQPLLQHGGVQPGRARAAHRRLGGATARATRACCSGSAGSRTTPTRCSTPPTHRARSAASSSSPPARPTSRCCSSTARPAPLVEDALGIQRPARRLRPLPAVMIKKAPTLASIAAMTAFALSVRRAAAVPLDPVRRHDPAAGRGLPLRGVASTRPRCSSSRPTCGWPASTSARWWTRSSMDGAHDRRDRARRALRADPARHPRAAAARRRCWARPTWS